MSKYTRKSKEKDDLKKPDEFVSFWHRFYDKAAPYGRAIVFAAGAAIVVLIVAWLIQGHVAKGHQKATEQFDRVLQIAQADLVTDANPKKDDDPVPRFKTDKERAEAALAEIDKLEKEHGGPVARRGVLVKAGLLYDLGRYADAEAAYRDYADKARPDDPMRPIAREGVALCLENQGKLDEALSLYKELEPATGDYFKDRALYDEGRVLLKKGDKAGAEKAYKEIVEKMAQSPLKDDAEAQLGAMGVAVPQAPGAIPGLPPGIQIQGG